MGLVFSSRVRSAFPPGALKRRGSGFSGSLTLDGAALGLTVLLPLFLLHVRVAAEAAFDIVAVLFLVRSLLDRRWDWLRRPWVVAALAWWAWTVACTLLAWRADPGGGTGHLVQAGLALRFLLFAAALEHWVLREGRARAWLLGSLSLAALYVAGQSLLQFLTGRNLFGDPRWGDGELTGPFRVPRAAPTLVRLLFPATLPAMAALQLRSRTWGRLAAAGVVVGGVLTVVLIGQRMPVLLTGLGLLATGLLLPGVRRLVLVAFVAGGALVGASAVVSPPTFYRLVTKFSRQMETFPASPYGQIVDRALAMAEQNPWTGLGFNGYQVHCPDPRYRHGWQPGGADDGGGVCLTHPHSYYLQALTDGGFPGLAGFVLLAALWLARLGRGLWRSADPVRAGLFVATLIQVWPIASTSPLVSLPIGGWFFLILGFGLAAAPQHGTQSPVRPQVG